MSDKDDLAALKARVEELERANKPPKPFKPEPWEPIDWTARMSMPPSAMQAMVEAVPDHILKDIVQDNRGAPTGPQSAIPSSQQISNVREPGSGWVEPTPLGPAPGIYRVDEQCIADEVRQRAELARKLGKE